MHRARTTWRHVPHLIGTLHDIQEAVQKAQVEVEAVKKKRHAEILGNANIFHGPASIVASYDDGAPVYFVDTILAEANAELERKRKEKQSACCIIQ